MKTARVLIIFLIVIMIFVPFAPAVAGWTNYNSWDHQLVDNNLSAISIDSDELIWLGTNGNGIESFDGDSSWVLYISSFPPGPISNNITDLAGDTDGNIWIATILGLSTRSHDGTWDEYNAEDSLLHVNIRRVVCDNDGYIWLGTFGAGMVRFDRDTTWTYYTTDSGLVDNRILSLLLDRDNYLWIGTYGGVSRFDRNLDWTNYTDSTSGLPGNVVYALAQDRAGRFWFGTDSGVTVFDGTGSWTSYNSDGSDIAPGAVLAITVDSAGNIWFGHGVSGSQAISVSKFDGISEWEVFNIRYGIEDNVSVVDAVTDSSGNIWFATDGDGFTRYIPDPVDAPDEETETLPSEYELAQNYPNPFNASTIIRYSLPERSKVNISIYNTLGQLITVLVDAYQPAGRHTVVWNGTDQNDNEVVSGMYLYSIRAGDFVDARKMILLK
nr:T9SS type A sorting domain-containing protein [candidate division Zixibacteria bacterium]